MNLRALLLVCCVAAAATFVGCELYGLDDSEIQINVPEQVVGPVEVPLEGLLEVEIPAGSPPVTRWLGPPPADLDLMDPDSGEPKLAKYKDKVRRIEIRRISYRVSENSLNRDLPPLEIYFAPAGSVGLGADPAEASRAVRYGQTGTLKAGQTQSTRVAITPEAGATDKVADIMTTLSFASIFGTHLTLKAGDTVPSGKMKIEIGLQLTVFADVY